MLIVCNHKSDLKYIEFLDKELNYEIVSFDEIRWHKVRSINHNTVLLVPKKLEISYHIRYLKMVSNANLLILSDNHELLTKKESKNLIWLSNNISKDYFEGCLAALKIKTQYFESKQLDFINNMITGRFFINNLRDVPLVSHTLSKKYQNSNLLSRGLFELLLNSFEHGIYCIGHKKKQQLINDKKYFAEIRKLSRSSEYRDKYIELIIHQNNNEINFSINDPGLGFDYEPYLNFNPFLSSQNTGRGIAYAVKFCFDKLVYKKNGSQVYASIIFNKNSTQ